MFPNLQDDKIVLKIYLLFKCAKVKKLALALACSVSG